MTEGGTISPKPFVFVLMPLAESFKDIYKFGIKGAAEDVNAYAERVDEQIFTEGILQRIINQISKADVVVADMTGRNPNVFYEVGYAHALGKIVLLLTQDAADIPFDLKHHQHTVYGGKIDVLRDQLATRLRWAIGQAARKDQSAGVPRLELGWGSTHVVDADPSTQDKAVFSVSAKARTFSMRLTVRNVSDVPSLEVTHSYMLLPPESSVVPYAQEPVDISSISLTFWSPMPGRSQATHSPKAIKPLYRLPATESAPPTEQFRLSLTLPALPPGAVDEIALPIMVLEPHLSVELPVTIRMHSSRFTHEFRFILKATVTPAPPAPPPPPPPTVADKRNTTRKRPATSRKSAQKKRS